MQRTYFESCQFASKACLDFAMQHFFKAKCLINLYPVVLGCVLRNLKGFFKAKSAQDLDVNIAISKYWLICVAPFEKTPLGIKKLAFLHAVAYICRNYLQKCNTFKVSCTSKSILFKNPALSKANVR